jgi:hypothetical protein
MMKLVAIGLAALALAGCAVPLPIVDMQGKDPVQTNRDMAWCQANQPAFAWGNPIATCMKAKGYTPMGVY